MDGLRIRPQYRIIDGFRMPLGFPPEAFRSSLTYEPRPDDVFITTYPKCGTTWMQHVVYMMFHDAQPIAANASVHDVFPHLEEVGREFVEALPPPRLIKTHLPLPMLRFGWQTKYIFVVRNPFDCAVSFFYHTRGFEKHYSFSTGTFDDFFEVFVTGEVDFGDYFEHLLSWYARASQPNMLLVTYESMKRDLDAVIVKLGAFLGGPAAAVAADAEARARIVSGTHFSRMSQDQQRWASARPQDQSPFVRKGIVGDWHNHFSREQLRRLLERAESKTRGTDVLDLWPDVFAQVRAALSA
jgi:hypothetical protein